MLPNKAPLFTLYITFALKSRTHHKDIYDSLQRFYTVSERKHLQCLKHNERTRCSFFSYVCFQGTSPEEETGFSPRLTKHSSVRQHLPQEGQWGADRSAHTSSQVSVTRKLFNRLHVFVLVRHHLSAPTTKAKKKKKQYFCNVSVVNCISVGFFYSSKALSSYRQIRRKYREQVWRLEQKVAAMTESHHQQSGAPKAAGEALEWRREETVL